MLWEITRKILPSQLTALPLKKTDKTWAINYLEKASIFRQHFSFTFQPHNNILCPDQSEKATISYHALYQWLSHLNTCGEVERIIHSTRQKITDFDLTKAEIASKLPKKTLLLLTYMYNSTLRLSYYPILWKFFVIVMVPKPNNPPDSPESYKPASFLFLLSEIFEKLILKCILSVIEANLPHAQLGFRHNHSTIPSSPVSLSNILFVGKNLLCTYEFFKQVTQAFDRVCYKGLSRRGRLFKLSL